MIVQFENVNLEVREHTQHDWVLESALVAEGYGVTESALRSAKSRNSDELLEGKHWVLERVLQNATPLGGDQLRVFWTKKGVIRLGFFIKSERAKKFRDWAEDLIVKIDEQLSPAQSLLRSVQMLVEQEQRMSKLEVKVDEIAAKQITGPMDYFAIAGYATIIKKPIDVSIAAKLGAKAKAMCANLGFHIGNIPDPRFGRVNTYPKDVLKAVFDDFFKEKVMA